MAKPSFFPCVYLDSLLLVQWRLFLVIFKEWKYQYVVCCSIYMKSVRTSCLITQLRSSSRWEAFSSLISIMILRISIIGSYRPICCQVFSASVSLSFLSWLFPFQFWVNYFGCFPRACYSVHLEMMSYVGPQHTNLTKVDLPGWKDLVILTPSMLKSSSRDQGLCRGQLQNLHGHFQPVKC